MFKHLRTLPFKKTIKPHFPTKFIKKKSKKKKKV